MQLDELDHQILEMLGANGRASNADISAAIGASQSAIKKRIDRLVDSGVCRLLGVVNPDALGYRSIVFVGLRVDPRQTASVYANLEEIPEAWYVGQLSGRYDLIVELVVAEPSEVFSLVSRRVAELSGVTTVDILWCYTQTWWRPIEWRPDQKESPEPPSVPTPSDWISEAASGHDAHVASALDEWDRRIIVELQRNGRTPAAELARLIGLSRAAVTQRTQRMFTDGVCRVTAVLDPAALGYAATVHVFIRTAPSRSVSVGDALLLVPEVRWVGRVTGSFGLFAEVLGHDLEHAFTVVETMIKPLEGVMDVDASVVIKQTTWLTAEWTPLHGLVPPPSPA